MTWLKRISFFILTNVLVLATIGIALNLLQVFFPGLQLHSGQMSGLIVLCAIWGMAGSFISLLLSKFMAKRMMGVVVIDPHATGSRERDLLSMVSALSQRAGLEKMPEVGIFESPEVNAFATGRSRKSSLVAVSTGLLSRMNRDEVEGVLGHEIAHVANGDMVTMALIQGVVNAFVMFFARIIANVVSSQVGERARWAVYFGVSILLDIVFGLLGSMVVAYFSRIREFRADAGGASFAGREKIISGLRRLQGMYSEVVPDSGALAAMKITNRPAGVFRLFSTHPSLEERIRRLQEA